MTQVDRGQPTFWRDPVAWWCGLDRPLQHLPRAAAAALLAALLAALAWSSFAAVSLASADAQRIEAEGPGGPGDLELYRLIHQRYAAGESYHAAAVAEQRANNYPTRPFVTVRLPTLAWIDVRIPGGLATKAIGAALLAAIVLAWIAALKQRASRPEWVGAVLLLAIGSAGLFDERLLQFHELVAGALLTLALALWRPGRWWPALLVAALALAVRELALPFLLLWGALAAAGRRWREVVAIVAVAVLFAGALALHAAAVAPHVLP